MLASCAVPAGLFLLLLLIVPETPRWLVMRGRTEEAHQVLRRLTNESEARVVLNEIEGSLKATSGRLFAFGGLLIIVGIMLSVFQQLVGINAVLYYAPLMFQNMGASTDSALLQTIIVGVANVAFTLVALVTVDHWGRKPLLILGALMMAVLDADARISVLQRPCRHGGARGGGGLHRRLRALVEAGRVGAAVGDLSERHQEQGHGDRSGGAMDRESVRLPGRSRSSTATRS